MTDTILDKIKAYKLEEVAADKAAKPLAAVEAEEKRAYWERKFLEAQENGFVPAGRINSAAGTNRNSPY